MSTDANRDLDLELKQQSVTSHLHWFSLGRRDFLRVFGGGLLVCACTPSMSAQESGRTRGSHELPKDVSAWLHIDDDGHITVFTGKVEMGQNIRTSLAQQVAEELKVPVQAISLTMGDTDLVPWDAGTFGSRTTPTMGPQLREMAAAARGVLIDLAAHNWKVDAAKLVAVDGKISDPATKRSCPYGELTHGQKLVKVVNADPALTPAPDWKVAGQPVPKVDGTSFVTGKHQFTSDIDRPGMLCGKVLRAPTFRATLTDLDVGAAKAHVEVTVVRDGDFVGVAAPDMGSAQQALSALKPQWKAPPQISDRDLYNYLREAADKSDREEPESAGSIESAMVSAEVKLKQTYTVAYIQHAPLEPRAAVAEWQGDKLTVWTGTQRPFGVRDQLSSAFRISSQNVRVLVPDTGSAYGGKHTADAAIEAARLAKVAGKPVKVVWTREEEFTWAYFRPAGVIDVSSGASRNGTIAAWEYHNFNSGSSGIGTPYNIANKRIQFHPVEAPLRQGSYRGLAATANHFARESHMDELAHAVGLDPLQFRLKNITNDRLRAVFEAVAEKVDWGKQQPASGHGWGIAGGIEKGGYVAAVAEVEARSGEFPKVLRIVEAFECGAVVNPNGLRNQIEGSITMGLGGALLESIGFDNGRITNPHFAEYRVPRFLDVPKIEVVLVDRKDLPSAGAGETPIVGVAPAIANAIFAATGERLRSMPMRSAKTA